MIGLVTTMTLNAQSTETEWNDWLMPGVGYKVYVPRGNAEMGIYHGVQPEFVIYAQARNGTSKFSSGPSRVKLYTNLSILKSTNAESKNLLMSNIGVNLSVEGKLDRNFLIPYFGLEIGGAYQKGYSSFQIIPSAGIQLISTERIIFGVQGGYQYNFKEFDRYSGYNVSTSLNVLLWEK